MPLKILFFGDIIGKAGREGLKKILPKMKKKFDPDITIGNAENLAHGFGITQKTIDEMLDAGFDFFTSGNHIWKKGEGVEIVAKKDSPVLRPHNYPPANPGTGHKIIEVGTRKLLVINLLGRVFMREDVDCPFRGFDEIMKRYRDTEYNAVFIDFHGEATSEKNAFGHYVDGRVSAVIGTHTHVATADAQITEKGTAYITDVGMNGPTNSVIGHQTQQIIERFINQTNTSHEVEEEGACTINAIYIEIDPETKKAIKIKQILDVVE